MDKEKEIEKIHDILSACVDYVDTEKCRNNDSCLLCYAEILYNAGYRKADEVRKEVLDEFYNTHYCGYMQAYDDEVKEPCVEGPCPHFKGVEDIRKETAELTEKTTALDIIELIHSMDGWNEYGDIIKAIAERYGVGEK